jgi:hypothetical protein
MLRRKSALAIACLVLFVIAGLSAGASEPPDAEVNPLTGDIESVESFLESGGIRQIRHVIDPGQGARVLIALLTQSPVDSLAPRIAIRGNGKPGVTWWQDGAVDAVLFMARDSLTGLWSAPQQLSDPAQSSRNPEIVASGTAFWVAFEFDAPGGGTGISVGSIGDDPEPFPDITVLVTTPYTGTVDVMAHGESGKVWTSWVHSGTLVGWSRYDAASATWTAAAYESYAQDTVDAARERIRVQVLGN